MSLRPSRKVLMICHINAMIALHEHALTFLSASFDDCTGSVAIVSDQWRVLDGMNLIFRPHPGETDRRLMVQFRIWVTHVSATSRGIELID